MSSVVSTVVIENINCTFWSGIYTNSFSIIRNVSFVWNISVLELLAEHHEFLRSKVPVIVEIAVIEGHLGLRFGVIRKVLSNNVIVEFVKAHS